jgi:hypothetical protein
LVTNRSVPDKKRSAAKTAANLAVLIVIPPESVNAWAQGPERGRPGAAGGLLPDSKPL